MSVIKICGLSTPETLEAALDCGADLVGFVFFAKSPRHLSYDRAAELSALVRGRARKVALTVNAGNDELDAVVTALGPDILQLHGAESPARVLEVRARYGLPVYKAIGVADRADIAAAAAYNEVADWLVLDAKPPKNSVLPGGNGLVFDWAILNHLDRRRPFMLSGGLDAANIGHAIAIARPDGVDVSSGVEESPGVKDPARIATFIKNAARAFCDIKAGTGDEDAGLPPA